jgi:hypothetical protein
MRLCWIPTAAIVLLGPMAAESQTAASAPYSPCGDSLYVALKRRPVDSLSVREYALFSARDQLCLQARGVGAAQPLSSPAPSFTPPPVVYSHAPWVEYKNGATATLFGLLVTGGGHFYAGEAGRGAAILGGAIASVVAGVALSTPGGCSGYSCQEADTQPLAIGYSAALGLWLYGVIDAHRAADRTNLARNSSYSHRPSLEPLVGSVPSGSTKLGLRLIVGR